MDLRGAILRAAKFIKKGKEPGILAGIRLKPHVFFDTPPIYVKRKDGVDVRLPDVQGYVMAADGDVGILIHLNPDEYVPDVVLEGAAIAKMLSGTKAKTKIILDMTSPTAVGVRYLDKPISFNVQAFAGNAYPPAPQWPATLRRFHEAESALRVAHYAGSDEERPELRYLHLTDRFIEASDQLRMARVPVRSGLTNNPLLIPKTMFKSWPRKRDAVSFGFTESMAFLYVDEEVRFGSLTNAPETFFNLSLRLPETHNGYRACVARMPFMQAVKFGTAASPRDFVELTFGKDTVEVCGLGDDGSRNSRNMIDAAGASDPVRLVLKGRTLWKSLQILGDAEIDLGYSAFNQPLRIEASAGWTALDWPMIPVEG